MPDGRDSFGCVITNDEKYVITFGCADIKDQTTDAIYIFDMEEMSVRKSDIDCPKEMRNHAILMGDHNKESIVVYGYIRWVWSLKQFNEIGFACDDIIELIAKWFVDEMVYLL